MIRKRFQQLFISLSFIIFFPQILVSQIFDSVENAVGLGVLRENNGFAVADYDQDNDLDLFVVAFKVEAPDDPTSFSRLFRNNNDGSFSDVTQEAGFTNLFTTNDELRGTLAAQGYKFGASWGDYDNDGFPDLFLTYSLKVQLWRNLGDGTFENVTVSSGIAPSNSCINTGATWFDFNNDGQLDLYLNDWNTCASNTMYQNNGDGTFTNVTERLNLTETESRYSYTAMPFDLNQDGWMDIVVSNDLEDLNYAYINNDGASFTEDAASYGLDSPIDDMGIAVSDFDQDQDFDFLFTGIDENALMTNNGSNIFEEAAASYDLEPTGWSWGVRFADFDLDGDEDVFIVNGYEFEARGPEQNVYFRSLFGQGENRFEDATIELGFNEITESIETIDFDYDNDGDLDLMVTSNDAPAMFYDNKILNFDDPQPSLSWLKVQLQGTISNRDAIGTTLQVTTANGVQKRYYTGVGFLSQSLQAVHFGLHDQSKVSALQIEWPSGIVEQYTNLDVNQTLKATEGVGIETLDIMPSQKIYGCTDPTSCSYNPNATYDDGSCTYLDANSIQGPAQSSFLNTETYRYEVGNESTTLWDVEGGHIIDGQGTNTITVRWGVDSVASVSVVESNAICSSLETSIQVDLDAENLSENISIARLWNEVLLEAIRGDFARPTIHARNLFHSSIAMYDIWAVYDNTAAPYLIGNQRNGFESKLQDFIPNQPKAESLHRAMSFAMYRLLSHRFKNSPGRVSTQERLDNLMDKLGYDTTITITEYQDGNAAAFGNFVAQTIIDYGLQDGAREATGYDNAYYEPINPPFALEAEENPPLVDPNRWQPLALDIFIDQGGNLVDGDVPSFLSPEWGNVYPFALREEDKKTFERNGDMFHVFHDPAAPPFLSLEENNPGSDAYKRGFAMVSVWQSHLDPSDGVLWDISPAHIGNSPIENFPKTHEDYEEFYHFFEGGSLGNGHDINPRTNKKYEPNIVPRGDYTRVLAEFWADGPDSETPPGHWFSILNYVNDHPAFEKRFQGKGPLLDPLEWDVKAYFILGSGMHDAAIAAWSVKGWYDYIRPISAIRSMAARGQSSDPTLANYHIAGIPLIPNYIEVIQKGDPLAGADNQHVGTIKLYTWKGHNTIEDPETDQAGVDWIRASEWYPYQRPTFVTPPFAGYVSGHSTYSRAAAELLTTLTGDEYFPGGMGEFVAKANAFLVFEEGPSVDVVLQWATYRDASDQTSLSRIWGGIHPPADDIPGRFIGQLVASDTFAHAKRFFDGFYSIQDDQNDVIVYPNPTTNKRIYIVNSDNAQSIALFDMLGRKIKINQQTYDSITNTTMIYIASAKPGVYLLHINESTKRMVIIKS